MSDTNDTDYIIRKGVPIPEVKQHHPRKYPFAEMVVGDSFAIPPGVSPQRVRLASIQWGKKHDAKFTVRKCDGGEYRCWRIK